MSSDTAPPSPTTAASPDTGAAAATDAAGDERPGLAVIANCVNPYRVNLHKLIAAGIPELKLHTLITHGDADFKWAVDVPESIHVYRYSYDSDSPLAGTWHKPWREWRKGGRLIEHLRAHDVRAVILTGYRYISYLRVIQHCHRAGIPLFVRSDSNIRDEWLLRPSKQWLKTRVYNWWMPRVSGVMSMGEYGDRFFLKYGADPARIYRVPYWPDFNYFARADSDRLEEFRRKSGLRAGRKYILYSGRLVPKKRVDLLVDAFLVLAAERPDWDLLMVGDGPLKDGLRRRVPETLHDRIVWTGFLDYADCVPAYHAADVLVLPSDQEPWALVIQEAMAAGLTVVASDVVGAAHELVEDGVSGRVFPAGDLAALTQALRDVTAAESLESYRARSRASLDEWRRRVDPVAEIRRALAEHAVLEHK